MYTKIIKRNPEITRDREDEDTATAHLDTCWRQHWASGIPQEAGVMEQRQSFTVAFVHVLIE
jgi:hypothetical protein